MGARTAMREPRKIGQLPSVGCRLTMRNVFLKRDFLGQQAFPGEEGVIFEVAMGLPQAQDS